MLGIKEYELEFIPFTNEFSAFMLLLFWLKRRLKTPNRMGYYSFLNVSLTKKSNRLKYRKLISEGYTLDDFDSYH